VKLGFVICVALLAACRDHGVGQMQRVRDELCACKNAECGEAALARVPKKDVKSTPRSQALAREMMSCLAKLYEDERPADPVE